MGEPSSPTPPRPKRDALSVLGMVAVAGAAAFTSYSGLDGLAQLADWPRQLALLLPVTVDAYAMTATRVWLSPARLTRKARAWARGNAIGAIATSVLGNTLFHAAAAHVLPVTWPVVVGISAIPSIVLGLTVHLWHVADDLEPEPDPIQNPRPASAALETVRAAYPVLGDTGVPERPAALGAKRTGGALGSAPGSVPASAPRSAAHAPDLSGASAPRPRPSAPTRQAAGAGAHARGSTQAPASPVGREERHRQQLRDASRRNAESVARGDGPISARALARDMHISQDTARVLIKELAQHTPSALPAPGESGGTHAAPVAPGQVHPASASPGSASAADPTPPGALASAPGAGVALEPNRREAGAGASADADTSAPGGALPTQRPAPLERANGAETRAP